MLNWLEKQKKRPREPGGARGAEGLLWAVSARIQTTPGQGAEQERGEHSAGALFDVGYFPPNTTPGE